MKFLNYFSRQGIRAWSGGIFLLFAMILVAPGQGWCAEAFSSAGIIEPFRQAKIGVEVAGKVARLVHKEGDCVKSGDPVVELEKEVETLEVERRKLIATNSSELDSALSKVALLLYDLKGTLALYQQTHSVSAEELRKKKLDYDLAKYEVANLKVTRRREQLEFQLANAELNKRFIKAPFDGIVVDLKLEAGESCQPQEAVFRVVDVSKVRFVTNVDHNLASQLQTGRRVFLKIGDGEQMVRREGVVEYIAPVADAASGLRKIKVLLDNDKGGVVPGLNAVMTLSNDNGLTAP